MKQSIFNGEVVLVALFEIFFKSFYNADMSEQGEGKKSLKDRLFKTGGKIALAFAALGVGLAILGAL